jgi:hypothetical protein
MAYLRHPSRFDLGFLAPAENLRSRQGGILWGLSYSSAHSGTRSRGPAPAYQSWLGL